MHIQLQLPTTPKLSTLFLSTPSSHFPKDFLSAVSISDNKTEAEGQLAVKRQVKELYPGAHTFQWARFMPVVALFITTFSPYTLGPGSAFCKLTCTLRLHYFGTSLPLFLLSLSLGVLHLSHSSKLFYHWVKLGERNMIFSSFLYTSPSLCPLNPHMLLFWSRTLSLPLSPGHSLPPIPHLSEPCRPFTAFYPWSHLFPSLFSPR